jgi:hypothetical protein
MKPLLAARHVGWIELDAVLHIVFTIISRNYAAQASALMKSLSVADPRVHRVVVVTDGDLSPSFVDAEIVDVWAIGGIAPAMALHYDALEFNTAVKPFAFKHLLDRADVRSVTYLDPDILVFRPLVEVQEAVADASIALTPHLTRPLGSSGTPTDQTILQAGAYNLGFLAARPSADVIRLMDWWAEKCRLDCRVDFANGLFTDQKWMDLAPGLVDSSALLRAPDLNLAYWNLPTRVLQYDGSSWTVDGRSLTFFHFSGFDPKRPDQLSRYQTHVIVEPEGPLAKLLELYARTLLSQGYQTWSSTPYGHAKLASGREVTPLMRRAALDATRRGERLNRPALQAEAWFDTPFPSAPSSWRLTRLAAAWVEKAGHDPRSGDGLAEKLAAFKRSADPDAVRGQILLEQTGSSTSREPLAAWPFSSHSSGAAAASDDPIEGLRDDDVDGASRAVSALWRCRADLRARFGRLDPDLLAWCLGPEAVAGRFVASLLSDERLAGLDWEEGGVIQKAAGFVLGDASQGDVREIQTLFGLAPRAGWPLGVALRERRDHWGTKDRATGLPIFLVALWAARPDLRMRLDLGKPLDRIRFLRWFASIGLAQYGLALQAMPRAITASLAFKSAWRPAPGAGPKGETAEIRVRETDTGEPVPGFCFFAAQEIFTLDGAPCAAPARVRRVIVETLPGAAVADLIALRARGTRFETVEARWPAAVVEALDPNDPVREVIQVLRAV